MQFNKAERKRSKLRLAIAGVSGSGKTTAALQIAKGLGGKIAVIDTENGSSSLYSDKFDFDVLELEAPYTPERFIQAIEIAEQSGYETVIIDSMSHEWDGTGGCLEINALLASTKYKGNSYAAWNEVTPRHQKLLEKIVTSKIHLIATVRSKAEIVKEGNKVFKVGMKYIMRDGFEYEFTTVFDLSHEGHHAVVSKDRTELFDQNTPFLINPEIGNNLNEWLNSGKNYYMTDENLIALNEQLALLPQDQQIKVRMKYPNFANEPDGRFAEIDSGLTKMITASEKAKAEQEQLDDDLVMGALGEHEPVTTEGAQ